MPNQPFARDASPLHGITTAHDTANASIQQESPAGNGQVGDSGIGRVGSLVVAYSASISFLRRYLHQGSTMVPPKVLWTIVQCFQDRSLPTLSSRISAVWVLPSSIQVMVAVVIKLARPSGVV